MAALNDALYAYDWLLNHGYSENHIILGGDSAGGGLAMALCHYLTDRDRILPAGIVAMSPWTDLTASGSSYTENFEIDPLFGNTNESLMSEILKKMCGSFQSTIKSRKRFITGCMGILKIMTDGWIRSCQN